MGFARRVDSILPSQPWKPGVHLWAASQLGCSAGDCSRAIQLLIKEGIRHRQVDGIVYAQDGKVLAFDSERVENTQIASLGMEGSKDIVSV